MNAITRKVAQDKKKYLRQVKEFLCRLNIPEVVENVDDDEFIAEKVFPIANEHFVEDYYRYRSADHYLRNREFYENEDNYAIHPVY